MPAELVPYEAAKLPVLQMDTHDLAMTIEENLGGEALGLSDLDRIKVPGAGGQSWDVPTASGEASSRALEGVIIHWANRRAYWESEFSGESNPPDCAALDAKIGHGNPGGYCSDCPLAEFGSGKDNAQACKATRQLFILTPESGLLPIILTLPPSSLKAGRQFFMRLSGSGLKYYATSTKFTLERDKSGGGITYSRVVMEKGTPLSADQVAAIAEYRRAFVPLVANIGVQQDEVAGA